jgi:hypothetical protein
LFIKTSREFLYNPVELPELETEYINGGRYYKTPVGNLPSVTTVLGSKLTNEGIARWKARVGEEEANKVSTQANRRGTAIHDICEKYLLGENYKRGQMPVNIDTFNKIKPYLDNNIGSIYGLEVPLWSAKLKTAGRADLLAGYNGINSVCDFKTSKKIKSETDIESYFLQTTCYSLMAEELTPYKFPQIVIIMTIDEDEAKIFIKRRDDYVPRVMKLFC